MRADLHFEVNRLILHSSVLPTPIHVPLVPDTEEDEDLPQNISTQLSQTSIARSGAPPYGQRRTWKPKSQEDFGETAAMFEQDRIS